MIASMTGYGRGEFSRDGLEAMVEVRSVNNRFCDVVTRLPRSLTKHEQYLKDYVKKKIRRGRINIAISLKTADQKYLGLRTDLDTARAYFNLLEDLRKDLGIEGGVRLEHLLNFSDIFTFEAEESADEASLRCVIKALDLALENLKEMRMQEGEQLATDLANRIKILNNVVSGIEKLSKKRIKSQFKKLKERVSLLSQHRDVDEGRLEMEIALMADKMDVTEECVRFKSHNKLFLDAINEGDVVGRRLDFLVQEMYREANTIAAKANDAEIAHLVVRAKEEIEKIKEQVQNVE